MGGPPSAKNIVASQPFRASTIAGDVAPAPGTSVDAVISPHSACVPALAGEVASVDLLLGGSSEDDLDVPLCDLFPVPGSSVVLGPSVSLSSHVGESACPLREKGDKVAETAVAEGRANFDVLCGTPLPQFEKIFGSEASTRAPKRGNCILSRLIFLSVCSVGDHLLFKFELAV